MSKLSVTLQIFALMSVFGIISNSECAPPTRAFDAAGAPKFERLDGKTGVNPPLNSDGNFLIGPVYESAPERDLVAGVPQGRVEQFTMDSRNGKLFNPGIARKVFGRVDPGNPKTCEKRPCRMN